MGRIRMAIKRLSQPNASRPCKIRDIDAPEVTSGLSRLYIDLLDALKRERIGQNGTKPPKPLHRGEI